MPVATWHAPTLKGQQVILALQAQSKDATSRSRPDPRAHWRVQHTPALFEHSRPPKPHTFADQVSAAASDLPTPAAPLLMLHQSHAGYAVSCLGCFASCRVGRSVPA